MRDGRARYLIVNADDFGQSRGINRGIVEAHERGIVTSASLMVRWPAAAEAAAYARSHPDLCMGLHFDLGEWAYRGDAWVPLYEVLEDETEAAVRTEAHRQLATFRAMVGCDPTHVDSHQHIHRAEPVATVLAGIADGVGVPLRDASPDVAYRGDFYGQTGKGDPYPRAITVEALTALIHQLAPGTTELGCHPGYAGDLDTQYAEEREQELRVLCDRKIRDVLSAEGVELRSFHDLRSARTAHIP